MILLLSTLFISNLGLSICPVPKARAGIWLQLPIALLTFTDYAYPPNAWGQNQGEPELDILEADREVDERKANGATATIVEATTDVG